MRTKMNYRKPDREDIGICQILQMKQLCFSRHQDSAHAEGCTLVPAPRMGVWPGFALLVLCSFYISG